MYMVGWGVLGVSWFIFVSNAYDTHEAKWLELRLNGRMDLTTIVIGMWESP